MGGRDMRLPAPVLILPSWLSRHQVELVNGHGQVSGTHRSMEENSTGADHDRQGQRGSPPFHHEGTMTNSRRQAPVAQPEARAAQTALGSDFQFGAGGVASRPVGDHQVPDRQRPRFGRVTPAQEVQSQRHRSVPAPNME